MIAQARVHPEAAVGESAGIRVNLDVVAMLGCVAAMLLALLAGSFHHVGTFGVETDFYWAYGPQAKNLLAGRAYTYPYHPPGYSLLLAAGSLLTGDLFVAGKLLSAIATAGFGWMTYRLVKTLFDARLALVATLLSLLSLIPHSFLAATDVVGAVLMLLPLWIVLCRPLLTVQTCLLAGLCAGLAYLVRTTAIAVVIGVGFSLLAIDLNRGSLRERLVSVGLFLSGVLLAIAPWWAANWVAQGQLVTGASYLPVAAHFYLPGGENNSITSLQQAAATFHSLWDVVARDPQRVLRLYLHDVLAVHPAELVRQVLHVPAATLAVIGLISLARGRSQRQLAFLLVCAFVYLSLGLLSFKVRLYVFLFPALFLLAACGAFHPRWLHALRGLPVPAAAVSWLLVGALAAGLGARAMRTAQQTLASEPRYLLTIARALRERSSPDDAIIVRKPHLAYLANLRWAPFPLAQTAEEFLVQAQQAGVRYIAYSDAEASRWSGLTSLADPTKVPSALSLIFRDAPTNTLIYEVHADSQTVLSATSLRSTDAAHVH